MRIWRPTTAAAIAVLRLSGCGGGGSSGSTAPPVVVTPTPTPVPTPTPTPSPTYMEATDFTANRDYPGWGVRVVRTYTAPAPGSPSGTLGTSVYTADLAPETRAAGFLYTASTKTYVVRWFSEERSYGPVTSSLFQGLIPTDTTADFNFARSHFRPTAATADYTRYLGYVSWSTYEGNGNSAVNSVNRSYVSLFGTTTAPSDLPTTGTYRFNMPSLLLASDLSGYMIGGADGILLTVNWTSGAITGTFTLLPQPNAPAGTQPLVMTFSGTVNMGSSRVTGNITGPYSGTFSGAVFGPRARELGIAMTLSNASGGKLAAVAGGKQY